MSPGANDTGGPYVHGGGFSFSSAGTINGIWLYQYSSGLGGPTAGQTVTLLVKDATGTTTLASVTMSAAGTTGEFYTALGTPLSVSASTTYLIVADDTTTAAFRVPRDTGMTSDSTVGSITRKGNTGTPVAGDIYYTDIDFTAGAAASATPAPNNFTSAAVVRSSTW
jgi:hypothetical protein